MPTRKPRFIITLESPEQHQLLKEFARVSGKSVSALLNELVKDALRPLVPLHRMARREEGQADLVEFLQALGGAGIGGEGAAGPASTLRSGKPAVPSEPPRGGRTPGSNTGVTLHGRGRAKASGRAKRPVAK